MEVKHTQIVTRGELGLFQAKQVYVSPSLDYEPAEACSSGVHARHPSCGLTGQGHSGCCPQAPGWGRVYVKCEWNSTLDQQSPSFLTPGTGFMKDNFFHGPGCREWGFRMTQVHYIQAHLQLCGLGPNRPGPVPVHCPDVGDPCFRPCLLKQGLFKV